MTGKRLWEIGGFVAGAILIAFGVVAIYMKQRRRRLIVVLAAVALVDLVLRLARLGEDLPAVAELDLNPVLALPDRCVAVDARIRVRRPDAVARTKSW